MQIYGGGGERPLQPVRNFSAQPCHHEIPITRACQTSKLLLLHVHLPTYITANFPNRSIEQHGAPSRALHDTDTMGWSLWSSPAPSSDTSGKTSPSSPPPTPPPVTPDAVVPLPPPGDIHKKNKHIEWNKDLNRIDWTHPREWGPMALVGGVAVGFWVFWRSYLRRLARAQNIDPDFFRKRSLFGKVTSVGDGDGFHLFHTPGGRLAGWGWLRKVPTDRKALKGRTVRFFFPSSSSSDCCAVLQWNRSGTDDCILGGQISIRLAGVDAPECAHFGKPAQPYSAEALEFLRSYILGRRVRAFVYRRDQYERAVATVFVRRPPFFLRKDVSMELLKRGLAVVYDAKQGAEFGGPLMEDKYRTMEYLAKKKKLGIWSYEKKGFLGFGKREALETPMAYKERIRQGKL